MPRCRRCGRDTGVNRKICMPCVRKWAAVKQEAAGKAIAAHGGEITADNLLAIQRDAKRILADAEPTENTGEK